MQKIREMIFPDYVMRYLKSMRYVSYYGGKNRLIYCYWLAKFKRLSIKLGYSIGPNCFGYGLVLHHHGTIVCGSTNRIGNYALLNTSTCIIRQGVTIGDYFFMGIGSTITRKINLGNNVMIGAGSVVNKNVNDNNIVLAGQPARIVKRIDNWVELYGNDWVDRLEKVEKLKQEMNI